MSALLTGFAAGGFARSLVSSIMVQRTRQIVWPLTDASGVEVQGPTQSGQTMTEKLAGYVAILEEHRDELEITEHPVEQGAVISDHAYKLPAHLTMQMGWSPSSLASSGLPNLLGIIPLPSLAGFFGQGNTSLINRVYQQLLTLQAQRSLLTIYTGKRIYKNMLLRMVVERTTQDTENALIITAAFHEILLASVTVLQVPTNPAAQAAPEATTPEVNQGSQSLQPAAAFNPGAVVAT